MDVRFAEVGVAFGVPFHLRIALKTEPPEDGDYCSQPGVWHLPRELLNARLPQLTWLEE